MVKPLSLLSLFILFVACRQIEPPLEIPLNAVKRTIDFSDQKIALEIYLPPDLDTLSTWDADCCTGGLKTTCFWNSKNLFVKTMHGLCFPSKQPDSICQVTITSNHWREKVVDSVKIDTQLVNVIKRELDGICFYSKFKNNNDTLLTIGNQVFAMFKIQNMICNSWVKGQGFGHCESIFLCTAVNSQLLTFWFECSGMQSRGYIEK